jgi:hypothetical protein
VLGLFKNSAVGFPDAVISLMSASAVVNFDVTAFHVIVAPS